MDPPKDTYQEVQSTFVHNPKLETIQMSINRRMRALWFIHKMRILHSLLPHAWMNLTDIMLNKSNTKRPYIYCDFTYSNFKHQFLYGI